MIGQLLHYLFPRRPDWQRLPRLPNAYSSDEERPAINHDIHTRLVNAHARTICDAARDIELGRQPERRRRTWSRLKKAKARFMRLWR